MSSLTLDPYTQRETFGEMPSFWSHVIGPVPELSEHWEDFLIEDEMERSKYRMAQPWSEWFLKRSCVRHKYSDKDRIDCIHCRWEVEEARLKELLPMRPGIRYGRRYDFTIEEAKNLFFGDCFCGKPRAEFDKFQRKYCTPDHSALWWSKVLPWSHFRTHFLAQNSKQIHIEGIHGGFTEYTQTCAECGYTNTSRYDGWEVDHILAIVNGGDEWDENNLRVLCPECHKKKTKQDMKTYRESKCATET